MTDVWECESCRCRDQSDGYCAQCRRPVDPTPEEIRQRCIEIQKTWTPTMRAARVVGFFQPTPAAVTRWESSGRRVERREFGEGNG